MFKRKKNWLAGLKKHIITAGAPVGAMKIQIQKFKSKYRYKKPNQIQLRIKFNSKFPKIQIQLPRIQRVFPPSLTI